jgi:glycosyltransferase involved in cell wall biosynthesis
MRLDLLITTFRRPDLLDRALLSIARADKPQHLQVGVVVIDNGAPNDVIGDTATLASLPFPVRVLHEPRPGKSCALNTGIAASSADYLGFIDDDEELAPDWFRVVEAALVRSPADFLGGRSRPRRGSALPAWVPAGYLAVQGFADCGPAELAYGRDFPGMLTGNNAVISRATLDRVGPYSVDLGPSSHRRLFSCEDEDMYLRLLDVGARGRYLPDLIVYHEIHRDRLRKNYYRAWSFWNGASKTVLGRGRHSTLSHIAGVPRYAYGDAMRAMVAFVRTTLTRAAADARMAAELPIWHLAGRLYGRFLRSSHGGRSTRHEGAARATDNAARQPL